MSTAAERPAPQRRAPDRSLCKSFDGDNVPFEQYRIQRRNRRNGVVEDKAEAAAAPASQEKPGTVRSSIRERQAQFLNTTHPSRTTERSAGNSVRNPAKLRTRSDTSALVAKPSFLPVNNHKTTDHLGARSSSSDHRPLRGSVRALAQQMDRTQKKTSGNTNDLDVSRSSSSHRRDLFQLQSTKRQGSVRALSQKFGGGSNRSLGSGRALGDHTSTEDLTDTSTDTTTPTLIRETSSPKKTTSYGLIVNSDLSSTSSSHSSGRLEREVQAFCKQDETDEESPTTAPPQSAAAAATPRAAAATQRPSRTTERSAEPRARSKSAPRSHARVHLTQTKISQLSPPNSPVRRTAGETPRSRSDIHVLKSSLSSSSRKVSSTQQRSKSSTALGSSKSTSSRRQAAPPKWGEPERRLAAYQIYVTTGKPSKERMVQWIEYDPRRTDVTVADLDLLPWKDGDLKLSKTKMAAYLAQ
mmetsp:Transcript_14192/g.30991  ORF Transcript_14192/g.30991 Transcript_14192/m.30991 type:complete len:469 (-) Transcript_14192:257-1663(-)|eukprot:CAMPEP_0168752026 /NCGR_PEP_ID=MMETSP0724-20121128/18163_1 /TAXON_ID=265536 /ORGANISM="Amphiprora sp., Strain CCMP467" /LENGTH=468 /DNA_ID=CAMNT_0008800241 /DNA_START=285 /DNA_END=1691 /DNA_ORIENTATION=+